MGVTRDTSREEVTKGFWGVRATTLSPQGAAAAAAAGPNRSTSPNQGNRDLMFGRVLLPFTLAKCNLPLKTSSTSSEAKGSRTPRIVKLVYFPQPKQYKEMLGRGF